GFSAVRIPITVGATSADDGGTDALVDAADAAPPGSCNVSGHIYLNGAIAYPSTMTACGALTPGVCRLDHCFCSSGQLTTCSGGHILQDLGDGPAANTPNCSSFTCTGLTAGQECISSNSPDGAIGTSGCVPTTSLTTLRHPAGLGLYRC